MGRDLQKRKNRSSRPTIRQPNKYKKPLNPLGNSLIAKNWDKKETLSQNYRRLGLTAKLGKATGGIEPRPSASGPVAATQDPLAVTPASGMRGAVSQVRVERDAEGRIVRVLRKPNANPLNDPLNELESGEDEDEDEEDKKKGVVAAKPQGGATTTTTTTTRRVVDLLEEQASAPTEKHVRHQSAREREWVEALVAKHGDDTRAMARDLKLNPMQQTEADIKRRIKTYREKSTGQ